jgi:hypothetical protein
MIYCITMKVIRLYILLQNPFYHWCVLGYWSMFNFSLHSKSLIWFWFWDFAVKKKNSTETFLVRIGCIKVGIVWILHLILGRIRSLLMDYKVYTDSLTYFGHWVCLRFISIYVTWRIKIVKCITFTF